MIAVFARRGTTRRTPRSRPPHLRRLRRALPMFLALAELVAYHLDAGAPAIADDPPLAYDVHVLRNAVRWFMAVLGGGQRPDAALVLLLRKLGVPPALPPHVKGPMDRLRNERHVNMAGAYMQAALDCLAVHVTDANSAASLVALESLRSLLSMMESEICGGGIRLQKVDALVARTLARCPRDYDPASIR